MGRYLDIARSSVASLPAEEEPLAASNRATELRVQARAAGTWDELDGVLKEAQAAYTAGHVTCEEVESLARYAMDRSRQIPDDGDGERLSELLARQPVVRVRSRLLGEVVVWLADNAEVPEDTPPIVYRAAELRKLVGASPEKLRAVHQMKKNFDGEVVEDPPELSPDAQVIPSEALYAPPDTCPACRQGQWWTDRLSGRRVCRVCHPPSIAAV